MTAKASGSDERPTAKEESVRELQVLGEKLAEQLSQLLEILPEDEFQAESADMKITATKITRIQP